MIPTKQTPWSNREAIAIAAITVFATLIRAIGLGRLGLDHFDEGIYAMSGTWSLGPAGLAGIDPGLIPYAPPGYPILVGMGYRVFGLSDLVAIAVSIGAGAATIPIVAWIGRSLLGPAGGVVASVFAALSGHHIIFSRMALTDVLFLLAWLVGVAVSIRFLDRPSLGRAVGIGLAVGMAQLVKYNGWLVGAIVIVAASAAPVFRREIPTSPRFFRTLGYGLLAALVAALVYGPWFRFVEAHGGYPALLRHQRSYLGGLSTWRGNWLLQLRQSAALSGGAAVGWLEVAIGFVAAAVLRPKVNPIYWRRGALAGVGLTCLAIAPAASGWWLGLALAGWLISRPGGAARTLGAWWLVMAILTPFYHPYARLWLPLEAAGWFLKAMAVIRLVDGWASPLEGAVSPGTGHRSVLPALVGIGLLAGTLHAFLAIPRAVPLEGLLGPRDSFRTAAARLVEDVPSEARVVRTLARPAFSLYASGPLSSRRIGDLRSGSLDEILGPGPGWAIVDEVILGQEADVSVARARLLARWTIVSEAATTLSPATLLDVDPAAAQGVVSARTESLLLLRRRP